MMHRHRQQKFRLEEGILLLIVGFILAISNEKARSMMVSIWYIYAIIFITITWAIGGRMYHRYKLSKAGINEIDVMSGTDFELFLSSLFSKQGYRVEHTGHTADLGVDLILIKDGMRLALQAKRYQGNVGPDAVREVVTALKLKNCESGMVVTNSYYTQETKLLAQANNVLLWNRDDLVNNILKI